MLIAAAIFILIPICICICLFLGFIFFLHFSLRKHRKRSFFEIPLVIVEILLIAAFMYVLTLSGFLVYTEITDTRLDSSSENQIDNSLRDVASNALLHELNNNNEVFDTYFLKEKNMQYSGKSVVWENIFQSKSNLEATFTVIIDDDTGEVMSVDHSEAAECDLRVAFGQWCE